MKKELPIKYRVYGIVCPDTHKVVYVGRTSRINVIMRLAEHISDDYSNKEMNKWLRGVTATGRFPHLAILEICNNKQEAHVREMYWINKLTSEGNKLFNRHGRSRNLKQMLSEVKVIDLTDKNPDLELLAKIEKAVA